MVHYDNLNFFRDDNVSSINMKERPRMSSLKSRRRSLVTKHFRDDDFTLSAMTCGTHYVLLFNTHTWSGGPLLLSDDKNANFSKMKEWWLSDNDHGKNISSLVSHIWPAFKFVNNTSIAICLCIVHFVVTQSSSLKEESSDSHSNAIQSFSLKYWIVRTSQAYKILPCFTIILWVVTFFLLPQI